MYNTDFMKEKGLIPTNQPSFSCDIRFVVKENNAPKSSTAIVIFFTVIFFRLLNLLILFKAIKIRKANLKFLYSKNKKQCQGLFWQHIHTEKKTHKQIKIGAALVPPLLPKYKINS